MQCCFGVYFESNSQIHISDLDQSHKMYYPSFSLKQELIDKVFHDAKNGIQKQTPSPGAIRMKRYHEKQKELRLQNPVVEECDQCEYTTAKYMTMYRHKREKNILFPRNLAQIVISPTSTPTK